MSFVRERRETVAPGLVFEARVYDDFSGSARLVRGDWRYPINERLDASRLSRNPRPLLSPDATGLYFRSDGGYGRKATHYAINGDFGRMHYPQRWAAGIRPALAPDRLEAWLSGGSHNLLRYRPSCTLEEMAIYAALLATGWSHGFVKARIQTKDYRALLYGLGYRVSAARMRQALQLGVKRGWLGPVTDWHGRRLGSGYAAVCMLDDWAHVERAAVEYFESR